MNNNWSDKRKKHKETIKEKTREKLSERDADRNLRYLEISDMALNAVEEYFKNKHYKKHVVKYKIYKEGKPIKDELVNIELDVADTKALANMVTSLEKIQKGQRLSEGSDNPKENENQEGSINNLIEAINKSGDKK